MLSGKVSKFSITFVLSNFPDFMPASLSRVLPVNVLSWWYNLSFGLLSLFDG
jgi:hypothetical protein